MEQEVGYLNILHFGYVHNAW